MSSEVKPNSGAAGPLILGGVCGACVGGGLFGFTAIGLFLIKESLLAALAGSFSLFVGVPIGLIVGTVTGVQIVRGRRRAQKGCKPEESAEQSPFAPVSDDDPGERGQTARILTSASGITLAAFGLAMAMLAWMLLLVLKSVFEPPLGESVDPQAGFVAGLLFLFIGALLVGLPALAGCALAAIGVLTSLASGRRSVLIAAGVGGLALLCNVGAILAILLFAGTF